MRPSTAIGRSPGSLVSRVGRSARSGSWRPGVVEPLPHQRAPSGGMSVPQVKRSVVVTSPFRLTERRSTRPGVAAIACSIGSATRRDASVAAAPG